MFLLKSGLMGGALHQVRGVEVNRLHSTRIAYISPAGASFMSGVVVLSFASGK